MVFWRRVCQTGSRLVSYQLKRYYFGIPHPSGLNSAAKSSFPCLSGNPLGFVRGGGGGGGGGSTDFSYGARFFASSAKSRGKGRGKGKAKAQAEAAAKKKEKENANAPRLNEQIRAYEVRLVTDEGHEIVSLQEALARARKLDLDLVEVQKKVDPPVCKIMDFHKEKYIKERKEKERAKSKAGTTVRSGGGKEVQFTEKIEDKDLMLKANTIKRAMEQGYRVKCTAKALPKKGSEIEAEKNLTEAQRLQKEKEEKEKLLVVLSRLTALIEDVSVVESGPHTEVKKAYVIVRHVKFGQSKKGGAKKLQDVDNQFGDRKSVEMYEESAESGTESEDKVLFSEADDLADEDLEDDKTVWSTADSTDGFSGDAGRYYNPREGLTAASKAASSPTSLNVQNSAHPIPARHLDGAERPPSSPQESPSGTENRYTRNAMRNQFPASSTDDRTPDNRQAFRYGPQFSNQRPPRPEISSVDNRTPDNRQAFRYGPQFSNQRLPQPEINGIPSMGERRPGGSDTSALSNLKVPTREKPRQEPSPERAPNTSASGYGIFSSAKANAPVNQGFALEVNKNKGGNPYDSATNSRYDGSQGQRQGIQKGGQGGFGIFSRDSSSVNSNRIPKSS